MIKIKDKEFVPFISATEIDKRLKEIGEQISKDFQNDNPLIIGVLNGAFMFLSDLSKHITIPVEISFVKMSSYEGTGSTGKVKDLIGLEADLDNRHVIIIEDIVDSGLSMSHLLDIIKSKKPQSVVLATLLFKPEALKYQIDLNYVGFEIPNKFVVGYGLDYDGFGRNIPEIYQLK